MQSIFDFLSLLTTIQLTNLTPILKISGDQYFT